MYLLLIKNESVSLTIVIKDTSKYLPHQVSDFWEISPLNNYDNKTLQYSVYN